MGSRNQRGGIGRARIGYGSVLLGVIPVAIGAALALGSGVVLTSFPFWGGVVLLFGGSTLVLSGAGALGETPSDPAPRPSWQRISHTGDVREAPKLGEIAVHHARLIDEHQLEAALAVHREERRRLGAVLVSMGLITPEQLAELLKVQQSHADHWGPGA